MDVLVRIWIVFTKPKQYSATFKSFSTDTHLELTLFFFFCFSGQSKVNSQGETSKPRRSSNGTLKLVSSSLETKSRAKSQLKLLLINFKCFALHLMKFDEIRTSAVSSDPRLNDCQRKLSSRLYTAGSCLKWSKLYCFVMNMAWIKNRTQSWTSTSQRFGAHCILTVHFRSAFVDFVIQKAFFWNIIGELFALCSHAQKRIFFTEWQFAFYVYV